MFFRKCLLWRCKDYFETTKQYFWHLQHLPADSLKFHSREPDGAVSLNAHHSLTRILVLTMHAGSYSGARTNTHCAKGTSVYSRIIHTEHVGLQKLHTQVTISRTQAYTYSV